MKENLYEREEDLTRAAELAREAAELSRRYQPEAADELSWIAEVMEGEVRVIRTAAVRMA